MTDLDAARAAFDDWQRQRHDAVLGPAGPLALIGYVPLDDPATAELTLPFEVRPEGDGALITAPEAAGVTVDGVVVDGSVPVARLRADGTPLIRWGTRTADVFSLDGTDLELRVYDATAPNRENFAGIEAYPYAPEFVVPAELEAFETEDDVPWRFSRAGDDGHTKAVPGVVRATIAGREYALSAFADSGVLVLVFADETTGKESYAPGRFLKVDPPADGRTLTLDFNFTIVPPCGFSDFYSCPLPPAQNRLATPVRAGEKKVSWRRPRH